MNTVYAMGDRVVFAQDFKVVGKFFEDRGVEEIPKGTAGTVSDPRELFEDGKEPHALPKARVPANSA